MLLIVLGGAAFGGDEPPREPALAVELHSRGWIAFSAQTPHGDWDLFLMRPDGSERRALTDTRDMTSILAANLAIHFAIFGQESKA